MGEEQTLLGPRETDVAEPPFLFEFGRFGERPLVREHALFESDQEHHRELEALGRVQRHQDHPGVGGIVSVGQLVGIRHQGDRLHELGHGVELVGHADQLAQVLEPALGLEPAVAGFDVGVEHGPVAGTFQDRLEHPRGPVVEITGEVVDQFEKGLDALGGPWGHARFVPTPQGVHEPDAVAAGEALQTTHRLVADASLGHVDDALGAHLVGGVDDHLQVGERVLDLLAVIEARPTHHPVGDPGAHE